MICTFRLHLERGERTIDRPRVAVHVCVELPLVRLGIESVIQRWTGAMYAGGYDQWEALLDQLESRAHSVNIVILGCDPATAPFRSWVQACKQRDPRVRVLLLLVPPAADSDLLRTLQSGADGYVLHSVSPEGLLRALRALAAGHAYIHPQLAPQVLAELRKPLFPARAWDESVHLSERERLLLQLAADGLNNTQIAEVLGLAEKTVRNVWSGLFSKLGLSDRTQAVLWALRNGHAELR
ncbi:MAG: response regulator transcription factor [Alicyclobacillus sp.]|nr:response regulator transcription factor [Alicyclobacillus sp.]